MRGSKRFGQNFLTDANIASSIVKFACLNPLESVFEIGPGHGMLTKKLAETANKVVALELDKRLVPGLKKVMKKFKNVKILQGDALSYDFSSLSGFKIVSNLPFNISTALTIRLLDYTYSIKDMILLYQREVAERLCAMPGQKAYGSLTLAVQYYAKVSHLMYVGNQAFTPRPSVESSVVRMTPREKPPVHVESEKFFFLLTRTLFAHRRKTILNNLKYTDVPKNVIKDALDRGLIYPGQRAESFTMEDFANLANHFVLNHNMTFDILRAP